MSICFPSILPFYTLPSKSSAPIRIESLDVLGMQQAIFDGGPILASMMAYQSFLDFGDDMGALLLTLKDMKSSMRKHDRVVKSEKVALLQLEGNLLILGDCESRIRKQS